MAASRERVVQNAERYVSRGKIESAIKEYRKLLADNPNDISTLNRVGDLYARIHRNSQAIDLFTQIAEQYAEDGFFVKAIAIYKKIIKLDPTLLEVYESLADLYHRQGLVNEARTQYQVLADYYVKHDRTTAAVGIYRRMAELEPDDPSHHVKLAEVYREEGRTDEAMGEYRAIADLMLQHGKGQEAARVFERALDVDAEDLGFITDAVLKLKEGGHVGPAAHLLAVAVERNPKADRVARIAGLPDRPVATEAPEPSGVEAGEEAALEEAPATQEGPAEAAVEEEPSAAEEEPSAAEEEPSAEEEEVTTAAVGEEPAEELPPADAEGGAFALDLDEESPESLVTPPADMLEDLERPGAAWGEGQGGRSGEGLQESASEAEPAPPAAGEGGTGTFEFELDLDADGEELLGEAEEPPSAEAPLEQDAEPELDHDLLERTAAEVHLGPEGELEDLLTEAEVLAKYGIEEKALERLAQLLQREPENLEAHRLMITVHLEAGRHDRVAAVAQSLAELAERLDDREVWPEVRDRLEGAGYRLAPGRIERPAEAAPESGPEAEAASEAPSDDGAEDEAGIELSLDEERYELPELEWQEEPAEAAGPEAPEAEAQQAHAEEEVAPEADEVPPEAAQQVAGEEPPAKRRRRGLGDLDAALAEITGQLLGRRTKHPPPPAEAEEPAAEPPPEHPVPSAAEPSPGEPVDPLRALAESLREEIGQAGEEEAASEEPEPAVAGSPAADPDDTGMSWLDEVSAADATEKAIPDETGFFDLGAELEQELSAEGELTDEDLLVGSAEQSLEEIVEGFKRGVAENLSPEDFDTHFNLGIAYREMGLLDEAIGEFQLAAKAPGYLVTCASMLGLCFREKGLPELALKWYQRGLEAPEISEEDRLGLLYDLGDAQAEAGERKAAYDTFVDVYGVNTNYRDVVARIAELEPRR